MRNSLLLMALIGCADGGSLIGDDIGILRGGDSFTLGEAEQDGNIPPQSVPNLDAAEGDIDDGFQGAFTGSCLPEGQEPIDPPMVAEGGANTITVLHQGVETGVEPSWIIRGELESEENTITMVYEETNADPSVETCLWSLEYVIFGVPAGTWTVEARGDTATAVVTDE